MELKKFLVTFLLSLPIQGFLFYLFRKRKLFLDIPKEDRKIHNEPTPRSGGLGILITLIVFYFLYPFTLLGKLLIFSAPLIVSSIWEDFKGSSYKIRFLFMFLTATLTVIGLNAVVTYFGFFSIPYWAGVIFSVFALIGAINAYNIIDGLNGLSSGLALLGFLTYAYLSNFYNFVDIFQLTVYLIPPLLGFLIWNYPWGKIFLGDTGSYFLGYVMGTISILLAGKNGSPISPWSVLLVMFYPVWETVFSMFRRLKDGKNPFEPDKEHFHFLLLKFLNGRVWLTTLVIWLWQIILDFLVIAFHKNHLALILLLIFNIILYLTSYRFLKNPSIKVDNS